MSRARSDAPLVAFTGLAIAGGGTIAASVFAELIWQAPAAMALGVGTTLLGAGVAASLAHLGRPARASMARRGIGPSPISNEVTLALIAIALAVLVASGAGGAASWLIARFGALGASLGLLVSIGLVYRIPGQLSWSGAVMWVPLTSGVWTGSLAVAALCPISRGAFVPLVLLVAAADVAVALVRWRAWHRMSLLPRAVSVSLEGLPKWLAWRLLLLDLVPAALLLAVQPVAAALVAAAGLIVDRVGFYATASPHTTEVEVDRVERLLDLTDESAADGRRSG